MKHTTADGEHIMEKVQEMQKQNTTGVFTNPFGSTINVLSNNNTTTGVPSAPSYKVQTDTAKFNDLTSSNPDWGMLIRYSGDPTPLQSISVTYSTS